MYSEDDLSDAVAAGVMSPETADAFRAHVRHGRLRLGPAVSQEQVRLVTGFNDVFVVIACSLLLGASYWLCAALAPWLGFVSLAVVSWALAEFFTRRRHMALPSIMLVLVFIGVVYVAGMQLPVSFVAAGPLGALAAWVHWLRFKVPITAAAGLASIVSVPVVSSSAQGANIAWTVLVCLSGIGIFALAMYWDRTDIRRATRRSDVAFWLHLLAAPLLVHPIFDALGTFDGEMTSSKALVVIALYGGMSVVSLVTDRRALMISSLVYVLYAFSALLRQYGFVGSSVSVTALVLGSALLLLSAFWNPCRAFLLHRLPQTWREQLPPAQ